MVLTAAGRSLLPQARRLLEAERKTLTEVRRVARSGYCDLRLGSVDSIATYLLPRVFEQLGVKFPDLVIKLRTGRCGVEIFDRTISTPFAKPKTEQRPVLNRNLGGFAVREGGAWVVRGRRRL